MNVAVTGARGFLGRNVVAALVARGHRVSGLDRGSVRQTAEEGARQADVDVTDPAALGAALGPDRPEVVIHLAATTIRAGAVAGPGIRVNVAGTQAVLEAARKAGASRCLVASSTAVFGDAVYGPAALDETTPLAPTTAYGLSKAAAESLVQLANAAWTDTAGVVVRLPALFGPWERATEHRSVLSPPRQLVAAAAHGTDVVLAEGGARDWTYAPDAADAMAALVEWPDLAHETYHIGSGTTWSVTALAQLMVERGQLAGYTVAGSPTLDYADDLARTRVPLDATRIRWELAVTFAPPEAACRRYLDWLDANPTLGPECLETTHRKGETPDE